MVWPGNDLKYCRQCWHIVITTQSNQPQSQHHYTSRQYWSFFRFVPPTRPRMALSAFSTLFCANTTQNQFQLVRTHDVVLRSQTCRLRAPVTTLLPLPLDGQPSRHSQHYKYSIMYQPGHTHFPVIWLTSVDHVLRLRCCTWFAECDRSWRRAESSTVIAHSRNVGVNSLVYCLGILDRRSGISDQTIS